MVISSLLLSTSVRSFLVYLTGILCRDEFWLSQGVCDTGSRWLRELLRSLWSQVRGFVPEELRCLELSRENHPILTRMLSPRLRLHNPTECPYNGSRRDDCHCRKDYTAAGFSSFQKIRLDLTSMQIISKFQEVSHSCEHLLTTQGTWVLWEHRYRREVTHFISDNPTICLIGQAFVFHVQWGIPGPIGWLLYYSI